MKILCFSDAHLLPTDLVAEDDKLADLLERALSDFDMVVVVGDLLEMYAAKGRQKAHFKRIMARYPRTFSALRHKNVKLVKGNHDDGCLAFLSCHIPVNKLIIDGYMFMHGHQADVMYSSGMMESVSEFIVKRVFWLESFFSRFTGFRITERFVEGQRKKRVGADSQRKYAEVFLRANPKLKGIVMGHTHIPLVEFYGRQVYLNTGAYIDGDAFLLNTTTGAVEIAWEDSNDA
jgi:UDP-2,3-diacylglucosamine pyrophosphatase LpxH